MKLKKLQSAILPLVMAPGLASATITFPALDVQDFPADAGFNLTDAVDDINDAVSIEATVFTIILDSASNTQDIADQSFSLSAGGQAGNFYDAGIGGGVLSGIFTVGGGLLTGAFNELYVIDLGGDNYQVFADVYYTGGSLAAGFDTSDTVVDGRLELAVFGSSNGNLSGKLGQINAVPVPAAVWLFGSGLIGLAGIAGRRKA